MNATAKLRVVLVRAGVVLALSPMLLLAQAPADKSAQTVEELKAAKAREKALAELKVAGKLLPKSAAGSDAVGGAFTLLVGGLAERYRTDQYTVYFIKTGMAYHKTQYCTQLRRSKDILPAKLTDVLILGKFPCSACGPPN